MKTFKSFLGDKLEEVMKPKAKGEKDFFDAHKVDVADPEDQGTNSAKVTTKERSGKRPADRLNNKQEFDEEVEELDELSPSTLDSYAKKRTRMLNKAEKEKPGKLNPKIVKAVGARDFTGYSDKEHGRLAGQAISVNRAKAKSREAKDMEMIRDLQRKNIESGRLKPIRTRKEEFEMDKSDASNAYKTIKAKAKNEEHELLLIALYDELHENNKDALLEKLDEDYDRLIEFAKSVAEE